MYNSLMRRSVVSVCLSLSILALFVGAGLWLLHRGDSEPATGDRPGGADVPIGVERFPEKGLAAGAAQAEPTQDSAGSNPAVEVSGPAIGGSELPVAIEGRVTDASGNGVVGARVAAVERKALMEAIEKDAKRLDREALEALRAFQRSLVDVARRLPSCLTAADGTYALRGLPAGDHRVVVTHPEFLAHREGGWILVETGRKTRYDVELAVGHAISGLVHDTKGGPIAGVRVRATPADRARLKGLGKLVQIFLDQSEGASLLEASPVETDSLGAFRLTSLEPGAHDLRLVKEGYAWGEARGVPSGTEDVLVALEPAIRIAGRVVSPAGEPVVSATIVLREPERDIQGPAGPMAVAFVDVDLFGEKERGAASDEKGRFALEAFSRGAYDLIVRAEGFPEHRREVAIEGAPLDLGDIMLAESQEIAGTVLSPHGRPVVGAEVWVPKPPLRREDRDSRRLSVLEAGPSSSIARSQTNQRGAFRLTGLGGDSHEVVVLAAMYPGDLLESVAAGRRGLTIALKRGLTIRGRVVDAESADPVPGARVGVEGGATHEQIADEDGRFELRGVSLEGEQTFGGSIVVRASIEGYREARQTVAFPDPVAAPVAEAELALRRPGTEEVEARISGVVRDVHGEPIADALVWTEVPGMPRAFLRMLRGGKTEEARTGADGTFAVPAPRHDPAGQRPPGEVPARANPQTQSAGYGRRVDRRASGEPTVG
ncbi:MAG: carboxypeptidase regulatory-like domain-containing protein [Planctomycetes bacterium]|nr:carboxypeptidase regulatory-like domain-containing protein [Planctomycetota bacterium]